MKKTNYFWIYLLIVSLLLTVAGCKKDVTTSDSILSLTYNPGLYPAALRTLEDVKWGYIDATGGFKIPPTFDGAEDFQENGLAVVRQGDRYGLIDQKGQYLLPLKYDGIRNFSNGRAVVKDGELSKVIDEKGQILFEINGYVSDFANGLALINDAGLLGYINDKGKVITEPKFISAGDFLAEKAVVKSADGSYALLDKSGKVVQTYDAVFLGDYREGLMACKRIEGEKVGYSDEKGDFVIEPAFISAEPFKNGLAVVNISEDEFKPLYGVINRQGEFIINPEYSEIRILTNGLMALGKASDEIVASYTMLYAIANSVGKRLTDFIYSVIYDYPEGYVSVSTGLETYLLDKNGEKIPTLPAVPGKGQLKLFGDIIKVDVDNVGYYGPDTGGLISYLDRNGQTIFQPASEFTLNNGITVKERRFRPNNNIIVCYPELSGLANMRVQENINETIKELAIGEEDSDEAGLDYCYEGTFTVDYSNTKLLVLGLVGYNYPFGAAHGMPRQDYVHINLETGDFYKLGDFFRTGSGYLDYLSKYISTEIANAGEEQMFFPEQFAGITGDQPFIITNDELQIYFYPYEIAPYAAGFPTFTISLHDANIQPFIDKEGGFWQALNLIE